MKDVKIQWHSGFVAAMDLELSLNRADLIYEREYNLNTKPLEIDLLVIKKDRNVRISNEIGRIFQGHNILEYKSPEDHLNIDTFYKSIAYACLYKAYGKIVDERKADDITISIVREAKPEGLTQKVDRELADAVLEVSVRANQEIVDELKGDEAMCQALLEIMEPEISKIVGEARKEGAVETATNMLKSGKFSIEEVVKYVPRLSIEEVKAIKEKLFSTLEEKR